MRTVRRALLVAGLVVFAAAGCDGGDADSAPATSGDASAVSRAEVGAELAGVRFDVRRDPG